LFELNFRTKNVIRTKYLNIKHNSNLMFELKTLPDVSFRHLSGPIDPKEIGHFAAGLIQPYRMKGSIPKISDETKFCFIVLNNLKRKKSR
jgi:hypothetical protein